MCRRVAASRKVARPKDRPVKAFKVGFVTFRASGTESFDARIFSFREKDWTVSLTTVEGRERFELTIGNYQRGMLKGSNPKSATLVKRQDGSYSIQIGVDPDSPEPGDTTKAIGVDLGRRDIAHTSEGENWNGQQLNRFRDHYSRLRAVLQRKASQGTRSSRRRCRQLLQRLSGRERRFPTWVNPCLSKTLVSRALATQSFIALEDLTGSRECVNQQPRRKVKRRRANSWVFYQQGRQSRGEGCIGTACLQIADLPPVFVEWPARREAFSLGEPGLGLGRGLRFWG